MTDSGPRDDQPEPTRCVSVETANFGTVSTTIVSLLEEVTGQSADELSELNNVVDTDALDEIFEDRADGSPRRGGILIFESNGCRVVVNGDGSITVEEHENAG